MKKLFNISFFILIALIKIDIKSIDSIDQETIDLDGIFAEELRNILKKRSVNVRDLKEIIEAEMELQTIGSSTHLCRALKVISSIATKKGLQPKEIIELARDCILRYESGQLINSSFTYVTALYDA